MKKKTGPKSLAAPIQKEEPQAITQKNEQALVAQATTLQRQVASLRITTPVEAQNAQTLLKRVIQSKEKAKAFIKPIMDNAKEGLRLAKEQEVTLVSPFANLELELRSRINAFLTQQIIAERAQQAEQDRLKAEYEAKRAASKRPERIKEPEPIPPEELIEVPKLESASSPMVPKYEIIDESKIPEKYWRRVLDRDLLWGEIRSAHKEKQVLEIPGIRIWEEASLTLRK